MRTMKLTEVFAKKTYRRSRRHHAVTRQEPKNRQGQELWLQQHLETLEPYRGATVTDLYHMSDTPADVVDAIADILSQFYPDTDVDIDWTGSNIGEMIDEMYD